MTTRIVVVGGGYGGMMAALRLSGKTRRLPVDITLVNASEYFVERLRLHEYAANCPLKQRPIRQMLRGTTVNFVQGWVTALDADAHEVEIDDVRRIGYDKLVYALGSRIDQESVPGAREYTEALNPGRAVEALCGRLTVLSERGGRVLVIGGGATGIEGAAEIKALNPAFSVSLITEGAFGAFKNATVQRHMRRAFQRQGIEIYEGRRVLAVRQGELTVDNGETMRFDLCLWAGGFSAPPLARDAGLQVNERGQIQVDPYLRSISHPEIYAVGDAAQPLHDTGAPYRMSVFAALVMGAHTADNLSAALHGKAERPFSFSTYGQAVALGPRDAVGFATFPNDRPVGPIYRGMLAVRLRAFFVWFLVFALELERRFPGFFLWFGKRRYKIRTASAQAQMPAQQV